MNEKEFIDKLRKNTSETVTFLSNAQKSERERMVVRAFSRCMGIAYSYDEIRVGEREPIDVQFRCANFQIMTIMGDRRLHDDWRNLERLYEKAKNVSDLLEPWTSSRPVSMKEISENIVNELKKKAAKYGAKGCARLDALVHVNLLNRHLYPPESDSSFHTFQLNGYSCHRKKPCLQTFVGHLLYR